LLGQLDNGLEVTDLLELNGLFSSCASFFSDRKSLMAARFVRETEVYEAQVALLDTLTAADTTKEAQVEIWKTLVAEEQKQSEYFTELVLAQKQIIDALTEGKSASSDEIVTILANVNETIENVSLYFD
jgi:hypothetical protein